jgi:hypothetical protein
VRHGWKAEEMDPRKVVNPTEATSFSSRDRSAIDRLGAICGPRFAF